jgi:hypothetical protein
MEMVCDPIEFGREVPKILKNLLSPSSLFCYDYEEGRLPRK